MKKGKPYNHYFSDGVKIDNISYFYSKDFERYLFYIAGRSKRKDFHLYISRGNYKRFQSFLISIPGSSKVDKITTYRLGEFDIYVNPFQGQQEAMLLGLSTHFDLSGINA